jgi:hypothetical protein
MSNYLIVPTPSLGRDDSIDSSQPNPDSLDAIKQRLFVDQNGTAFCQIPRAESFICVSVYSGRFRAYLRAAMPKGTKSSKLDELRCELEDLALSCGRKFSLHTRVAQPEDTIYIDLADNEGRIVAINSHGYKILNQVDPLFYCHSHLLPLPTPVACDDPELLMSYLASFSDAEKRLVLAFILSAWFPQVEPHILMLIGPGGSAKSTRTNQIRQIVDPSIAPSIGLPSINDLPIVLEKNAMVCFENVATINRAMSDAICRAITGSFIQRRRLFTDDDIKSFTGRRPFIINGVAQPSHRPDFMDRTITVHCQRLDKFEPREHVEQKFEKDHPKIFGFLLSLLAKTLSKFPNQPTETSFRMASFVRFGRAVTEALNRSPEEFDEFYRDNQGQQSAEMLDTDELTRLLHEVARQQPESLPWEGTLTSLKQEFEDIVAELGLTPASIPKSLKTLSAKLSEIAPILAHGGLKIIQLPRTKNNRNWRIELDHSMHPSRPKLSRSKECFDLAFESNDGGEA